MVRTVAKSALGLGSLWPHLCRDWADPRTLHWDSVRLGLGVWPKAMPFAVQVRVIRACFPARVSDDPRPPLPVRVDVILDERAAALKMAAILLAFEDVQHDPILLQGWNVTFEVELQLISHVDKDSAVLATTELVRQGRSKIVLGTDWEESSYLSGLILGVIKVPSISFSGGVSLSDVSRLAKLPYQASTHTSAVKLLPLIPKVLRFLEWKWSIALVGLNDRVWEVVVPYLTADGLQPVKFSYSPVTKDTRVPFSEKLGLLRSAKRTGIRHIITTEVRADDLKDMAIALHTLGMHGRGWATVCASQNPDKIPLGEEIYVDDERDEDVWTVMQGWVILDYYPERLRPLHGRLLERAVALWHRTPPEMIRRFGLDPDSPLIDNAVRLLALTLSRTYIPTYRRIYASPHRSTYLFLSLPSYHPSFHPSSHTHDTPKTDLLFGWSAV